VKSKKFLKHAVLDKYVKIHIQGDSRGIMSPTKFSMQPTIHFRNLLWETLKKIRQGICILITFVFFLFIDFIGSEPNLFYIRF
jgi:hypothetical protein